MRLFVLLLLGCSGADPCAEMCSLSTRVYGACLADGGSTWNDAGYTDERDYFHACETWAWELRLLEKRAKREGQIKSLGSVNATCEAQSNALEQPSGQCDTWASFDWEALPW